MKNLQQKWYFHFIYFTLLMVLLNGVVMPFLSKEPIFQDFWKIFISSAIGGAGYAAFMIWVNKKGYNK